MLTETAIRTAKPRTKPYKLYDEKALSLLITPHGAKCWRWKFRQGGRERGLALGLWPDVSLREARDRRDEARKLLARGEDPAAASRAKKAAPGETFEAIAREFLAQQAQRLAEGTVELDTRRLENNVFPTLGKRPIAAIEASELLACLKRMEARGILESARRVKALTGRIFRFAIATGRAKHDITADLRGAIAAPKVESFAAITEPAKVGALLRALDSYEGQPSAVFALRLAPLVFVRPGELRQAEWREFDLESAEWRVPAERMKMRETHIVPLSRQAVEILKALQEYTGNGRLLFPGLRSRQRPISDNTVNAALRRLGYSGEEMTGHGFRSMASTLLNEQGWHPDLIELQLAHAERNKVRAAYNRAQRLEERRKMMQAWADYLDGLKRSNNVVPLHPHAQPAA